MAIPGQMRIAVCFSLVLLCFFQVQSASQTRTLHLNSGPFLAVDSTTFPYFAFNETDSFVAHNAVLQVEAGDSLFLTVVNHDSIAHSFAIDALNFSMNIPAMDSLMDTLVVTNSGAHIYHDPTEFPRFQYLGAAGIFLIKDQGSPYAHFYWNFKSHESNWNQDLANNITPNWQTYAPNYFTVNGNGKPGIVNDSSALVKGNVGDTIRIVLANTGLGVHSIHFHGFHCTIIKSSQNSQEIAWSKDTFPIRSMEILLLEMVPDKPGFYPVHDHNLIAVSGGGYYPNGIFMMLEIN